MSSAHSPEPRDRSLAVALKYTDGDAAPRVVAKGRGLIAEEIIARAREHGVFVHQSPELVSLLSRVDIDDHIPPVLYVAVAELLAWLYQVEHHPESAAAPPDTDRAIPPDAAPSATMEPGSDPVQQA